MTPPRILTINGGSSSIKFAVFAGRERRERLLTGKVERIGEPGTVLKAGEYTVAISASNHSDAAKQLMNWLEEWNKDLQFTAIGHRVVHGGLRSREHQIVTPELLAELRLLQPLDLAHLPREIALIEAFQERFPAATHIACFDTIFHHNLPRAAQLLPIPRRYFEAGVRRLGFH